MHTSTNSFGWIVFPGLLATLLGSAACGDDSGAAADGGSVVQQPATDDDSGVASGGAGSGALPGDSSDCDHLLSKERFGALIGTGAEGLASDGSDVFVSSGEDDERSLFQLKNDAFVPLGSVMESSKISIAPTVLIADAKALYTDIVEDKNVGVYRIERSNGQALKLAETTDIEQLTRPPIVSDGEYLYFQDLEQAALHRIPVAGGSEEKVGADAFYNGQFYSMAVDDAHAYTICNEDAGFFNLSAFDKAGIVAPNGVKRRTIMYELAECDAAPRAFFASGGKLYLACTGKGGGIGSIYQLIDDGKDYPNPDEVTGVAKLLYSAHELETDSVIVAGGNIYFAIEEDSTVYSLSTGGGQPKPVLHAHGVNHMAVSSTDLYVTSSCGVHRAPL